MAKVTDRDVKTNVVRLDPNEVIDDPKYNSRRRELTSEEIERMASSIAEFGQAQPGSFRVIDGKKYVITGRCRLAAVALLNSGLAEGEKPYVWEAVERKLDDKAALTHAAIENAIRRADDSIERAEAAAALLESGRNQQDIARILGEDEATVSNLLKLLELPKKIQVSVKMGDITTDTALFMARLKFTTALTKDERDKKLAEVLEKAISARKELDRQSEELYTAEAEAEEAAAAAEAEEEENETESTPASAVKSDSKPAAKKAAKKKVAAKKGRKSTTKASKEDVARQALEAGFKAKAQMTRTTFYKYLDKTPEVDIGPAGTTLFGKMMEVLDGDISWNQFVNAVNKTTGYEKPKKGEKVAA